jgi:hypothetical protein
MKKKKKKTSNKIDKYLFNSKYLPWERIDKSKERIIMIIKLAIVVFLLDENPLISQALLLLFGLLSWSTFGSF